MKNLLLSASIILISLAGISQTKTTKAFFVEYDKETKVYTFEDAEGDYLSFDFVQKEVLDKFPLQNNTFVGKSFTISYTIKVVMDEDGDEYDQYTITKMEETKLEKSIDDVEEE